MIESRGRQRYLVGLMRGSLRDYSEGDAALPRLVRDIESLVDSLEQVAPHAWVQRLRSEWAELEILHALMLDQGRTDLTHQEQRDVRDVIDELEALIAGIE